MNSIWSWGRHSKVDCNNTLPWGSLTRHILTSLGRFDFEQSKLTPNWKTLVGLESRLKYLSNELSSTQFGHMEGLQKLPKNERDAQRERNTLGESFQCKIYTSVTHIESVAHREKGLKLCQIASNFLWSPSNCKVGLMTSLFHQSLSMIWCL